MAIGTVKWFDIAKGYGFITSMEGDDLFVHFSEIQAEGYRALKNGQRVSFEVASGEKGAHALRVVPVPE